MPAELSHKVLNNLFHAFLWNLMVQETKQCDPNIFLFRPMCLVASNTTTSFDCVLKAPANVEVSFMRMM